MKHLSINVFWGPHRAATWSCTFTEYNGGERRHVLAHSEVLTELEAQHGPWVALRLVWLALASRAAGGS